MAKNKNEGEIRRRKTLRYEKEKGSGDCRMGVSAVRLCAPVPDYGRGCGNQISCCNSVK